MTKILLTIHIIAVIVAIGPVAVAASMFPPAARKALTSGDDADMATLRLLNRICKVYALVAIAVPFFGFATAGIMGVTGNLWIIISIVLTGVAALVLGLLVLPYQQRVLEGKPAPSTQLAMYTGLFNLLWVAVTVVMIFRPGSSLNS
ncbi:hypothetical protein [Kutzneria buriramensis]|uniref:Uncharacterized protein n=1 Tax=Kutzneria buriramensis TaxID=1045776 RepID=A0A3E0IAY4_9PSEU|nr:hypothetical protein [Kutzneria buriramensis]REH55894.1 hypothetical protein BCF44_101920 [Kutzneria buriramensis]